ncbi:MAG TPA: hypothetical protein EYH54_05330 [Nautiliaceae bacterium]|nr:hypothetical protein [Nautiliaceae bacterium]
MKLKKAQMFIISAIIISLGLIFLAYKVNQIFELNRMLYQRDYLASVNFINTLLETSYNQQLIEWMFLDCEYRIKIFVLNPTIEGFRIVLIRNLTKSKYHTVLGIDCKNVKFVDQYGRKIFFETIPSGNTCTLKFKDFLDSYTGKYYYLYFNCKFSDPQVNIPLLSGNNLDKYFYQVFNLEYRDLFDKLSNNLFVYTLQKQDFSLISFKNTYNTTFERFDNQSDWLYKVNLELN